MSDRVSSSEIDNRIRREITNEDVTAGHDSPFYYNAGELFVLIICNALVITLALSLNDAIQRSFDTMQIGGAHDTVGGAWAATVIILVATFIGLLILNMIKRSLMFFIYKHTNFHGTDKKFCHKQCPLLLPIVT